MRPYIFHGLDLNWKNGDAHATGDCPWCGKENHFSVSIDKGLWRCLVCGEGSEKGGGNALIFLRMLHSRSDSSELMTAYLLEDRKLLGPKTVDDWRLKPSLIDRVWLVPGYNAKGDIAQLYRFVKVEGKYRLLATPELSSGLFGVSAYDKKRRTVWLCEGPWDGMALYETLRAEGSSDNVLAVPGANTFQEAWRPLFAGKTVNLLFDNDYPKRNPRTGKYAPAAGTAGMKRVAGILSAGKAPPKQINYVHWGDEGYDPGLPDGYDVRDALMS